jgi:hypothetical protein
MKLTRFEDLECWQEARKLVQTVYAAVAKNGAFQKDLRFVGQITAAAVSLMNNISEGWASLSNAEFVRYTQANKEIQIIDGLIRYLRSHDSREFQRSKRT